MLARYYDKVFDWKNVFDTFEPYSWKSSDDSKSYIYTIDLPGYKPDQVKVDIESNIISIKADSETRHCHYSISTPTGVDGDNIDASLINGVLTLTIPKKENTARPILLRTE